MPAETPDNALTVPAGLPLRHQVHLMEFPPTVRAARTPDFPAIEGIYSHYVRTSTATFEEMPPGLPVMTRRMEALLEANYPVLVAQGQSGVIGYAYASPYRTRPAYRNTAEDTVYVHPGHLGNGIGGLLLNELIAACTNLGLRQLIAVIGGEDNSGSIRLHEKLGFRRVALLEAVGYKPERWVSSVMLQRALGTGTAPPGPLGVTFPAG